MVCICRKEMPFFNYLFEIYFSENVALNKSAWQQDTKFNYLANKGVDGHKSYLHMYSEECVTSEYNATSAWRVDLENVLSIHHISIQFATNNNSWSMAVFRFL